jgi:hypothetical protein
MKKLICKIFENSRHSRAKLVSCKIKLKNNRKVRKQKIKINKLNISFMIIVNFPNQLNK